MSRSDLSFSGFDRGTQDHLVITRLVRVIQDHLVITRLVRVIQVMSIPRIQYFESKPYKDKTLDISEPGMINKLILISRFSNPSL